MEVADIEGHERHCFGELPAFVVGAGVSSRVPPPNGAITFGANPRRGLFHYVVSLDLDYFRKLYDPRMCVSALYTDRFADEIRPKKGIKFIPPLGDKKSTHKGTPKKPAGGFGVLQKDLKGYRKCNLSGIAAACCARYLTRGPIVLAGFDLIYSDEEECIFSGKTYEALDAQEWYRQDQVPRWKAYASVSKNVFVHPEMGGPLVDIFPKWEGE